MVTRVRTHVNPLNFIDQLPKQELADLFEDPTLPLDLEIGFGKGKFIQQYAIQYKNRNIIGVEVRKPLVEELKQRCKSTNHPNLTPIHGTDKQVFEAIIKDNSIEKCFIFHPDPWLKKRHFKRRVINPTFINTIHKKLKKDGKLYISTDVETLFKDINTQLTQSQKFKPTTDQPFWQTTYTTHWDKFSQTDQRILNKQTYIKI
jgi:tRNA (guanine-N7-)-methyltransferase